MLTHRQGTLEAEAEAVRREARRRFAGFIREAVNPGSYFRERDCRLVDPRTIRQAAEIGLLPFSLPAEVGGAGRSKFDWGVVIEELARISLDPGFPVLIDTTVEITEVILSSGRKDLIDAYVPDLVRGRRYVALGAYESRDPYDYASTARLDGDTWVLNGAKHFVTGGLAADLFVMFLRDERSNDMLAFVVEKDDPGVGVLPLETMGLRSMGLAQVMLHEVRVPAGRLLWRADGLSEFNSYARGRRIMSACGIVGALQGVIENCVESLASRTRSGRRVLDYPNVERSIGEMRMLLEASRATVLRALDGTRAPDRDPYYDEAATVAKHHAAESAVRIGQLVMNLQGGEGYISAFPWERFMRDVLGMIGGQGAQELLLMQLGQRTIVALEGARTREDAAERAVARLADSWSALHAAEAFAQEDGDQLPDVVHEMVSAAGLGAAMEPGERSALTALLDRAHALAEEVRSGVAPDAMPQGPAGLFGGRLGEVASEAWAFLASCIALENGLFARLLVPCTVQEAAGLLSEELTRDLLEILVDASVIRRDSDGRYAVGQGFERVLVGGPRSAAFTARLRRALVRGDELRNGKPVAGGELGAGSGDESQVLADAVVNSVLGRLEGLPDLLVAPGARVGCAADDGGRSAAALAQHIPTATVLALEPDQPLTGDRLALAWLPTAGLPAADLAQAVMECASALAPGGWLVLPCPLLPRRRLGALAARLDAALAGGVDPADGVVESMVQAAGLGHVRAVWQDDMLGLQLVAARRP